MTERVIHVATATVACGADRGAVALDRLPVLARELVEVGGWDAAILLLRARGGTRMVFGRNAAEVPWLVDLVGADAAAAYCRRFGAERIDMPKYDSIERQMRHARVCDMRTRGCGANEIAITMGYSRRNVMLILAGSDAAAPDTPDELPARDTRQIDMFVDQPQAAGVAHDPFGLRARSAADT